jgi:hypothetical protein
MKRNTRLTQTFIGLMVLAAIASTLYAGLTSHTLHASHALAVLALAAVTSRMKIKLPGIDGNMFKPEQMLFNVSMMAFATSMANLIWNAGWLGKAAWASEPLMLASATAAFFLGQTAPVAGIIKVAEGAALRRVWLGIVQLSFPYYVVSAGMTSMTNLVSHHFGWQAALVVFPVMYGIHRSYRLYFSHAAEALRTTPLARTASAGA